MNRPNPARCMLAVCAALTSTFIAQAAAAQNCMVNPRATLAAPMTGTTANNQFGSAMACDGDRALVAAIGNDQFGTDAGTVYAMRRVAGVWSITQTIGSPDASATDQFGSSIAFSGDWAIIGAPQEDPNAINNCGAAYTYHWDGSQWLYHSRLTPTDIVANKQFARSVAIDGNVIVCSAVGDIQGGNGSAGAAYVFRYNGASWVQEKKLMEQTPAPQRRFGQTVAVQGNMVLAACLPGGTNSNNTEGIYMFQFNGADWLQTQRIQSPIWPGYEDFGATICLDGDTLVANATPIAGVGRVRVYHFDGAQWTHQQEIVGPVASPDGRFGLSLDLDGDVLVIGAPQRRVPNDDPFDGSNSLAGLAFLYERSGGGGGTFGLKWAMRAKPIYDVATYSFSNPYDEMATSLAVCGDDILAGATTPGSALNPQQFGYVTIHSRTQPDCDANGVPDACDPDCNLNDSVDACEIAQTPGDDCDLNGSLDICGNSPEYLLDQGLGGFVWVGTPTMTFDMLWLNQYRVVAGGQRITHIALPWTFFTPGTSPLTLTIYADPNNDGDPNDATLLMSVPAVSPEPWTLSAGAHFTMYKVPTTLVGPIGRSFFVGAGMNQPSGVGGAMVVNNTDVPNRSWKAQIPLGTLNVNAPPPLTAYAYRFLARAYGLDCNGNGVNDQCDIAGGFSQDLDANGIPDECDDHCPADVNRSGTVDVGDLLAVISAWGPCPPFPNFCPADTNHDLQVNVSDLLAVISGWGACS